MKRREKYRIGSKHAEKKKGTRKAQKIKAKEDENGLVISNQRR
jgi:hypothetical protein